MTGEIPIVIGLIVIGWAVLTYNRFIQRKNRVQEAWSGIDVQLRRRFNLVENLSNTVKGYMDHERGTITSVTGMRMDSDDVSERAEEEHQVATVARNLLAVAEDYPDLKASDNFQKLQDELSQIESEIQDARRYYNGAVRRWNVLVESVPSNIIANIFNFRQAEYFEIDLATQRDLPKVDFK